MHWRQQGDLGELSAMEWFASKGAIVCFPLGHSPDWDFVAQLDRRLIRVQVKTCIAFQKRRWRVSVCTRGGNQSWSGLVKRFDPASCDYLFAVVGDGRRWCIPADALQGKSRIALGGPRYAEFEVELGRPLPARTLEETTSRIASEPARGDVRAAKGSWL
jgi:PD-(D/E)XK endonuclease